jgi:arylsulfatase A-like enzyme
VQTSAEGCFTRCGTVRGGMPKDHPEGYNRPLAGAPDPWSPSDPKWGGFWEGGRHWSEVVADETAGFLGGRGGEKRPFFAYAAFNAPHDPRQSPEEFLRRYPHERVAVPPNFLPLYPWREEIGCGERLRDEKLAPFPRTEFAVKTHLREYHALITHMDEQIGRILEALKASGQEENTWIFFTADHGLAVGRHGLFGKQNLYDHSIRVPFIVKGPGVRAGHRVDAPVYLQDVMATALELAGARKPEWVEFQSVLPLLRGEEGGRRDAIYGGYLDKQRAVIADGWKLVVYPGPGVFRLYHLAEDPDETRDLAGVAAHSERVAALFQRLQELQAGFGDDLDLGALAPR